MSLTHEKWVLKNFSALHNNIAPLKEQIVSIRKLEQDEFGQGKTPDFAVFNNKMELIAYVEITEALDKNRKRDDEYKLDRLNKIFDITQVDYLPQIQNRLDAKCKKFYPKNTWLLIYQNIFSAIHDDFPGPQLLTLQIPALNCFSQIIILDSDGKNFIHLYRNRN